jgi:hypothetical protein
LFSFFMPPPPPPYTFSLFFSHGAQQNFIINAPLYRESCPLQTYVYPTLGSKITMKLVVNHQFFRIEEYCSKEDLCLLIS